MKMKKLASLVLAGVMSLSLATSALATTAPAVTDVSKATTVKVPGTTVLPTIKIVMPSDVKVLLNPYNMKLKADYSGEIDTAATGTQKKVISPVYFIQNQSNIEIKVGVTATGTASTGVTLESASVASATVDATKKAFVQLVMKAVAVSAFTAHDTTPVTLANTDNPLVLGTAPVSLAAGSEIALKAGTGEALSATNTDTCVLAFQFQGDTSKSTSTWTAKDTVGATLAFTFMPQDVA